MQNFLIRKDVLKLINAPASTQPEPPKFEVISDETIKKKKEEAAIKQRVRAQQFSKAIGGTVAEKRHAEKIITTHINDAQAIKSKLQENLKSQGDLLNQRLMQRKAARQRGSSCDTSSTRPRVMSVFESGQGAISSSPNNTFNEESDRSGGPSIRSSLDQFEEELEKLMEKFVEEKMLLTRNIKNKYKQNIDEVKRMGEGGKEYVEIVTQIVGEIEKSMNEELNSVIKELEAKRKEEIGRLRKRICY